MWDKKDSHTLPKGKPNGFITLELLCAVSHETKLLKIAYSDHAAITFLGIFPRDLKIYEHTTPAHVYS